MSKLAIRYFIDGAQVDEQVLEEDLPEADLQALIEASKHGVSECVSEIDRPPGFRMAGLAEALKRASHPGLSTGRSIEDLERRDMPRDRSDSDA